MKYIFSVLSIVPVVSSHAATMMVDSTPNLIIPDNSTVGVADFLEVTTPITSITSVEVAIDISGGFNGDYYAYLQHSSGFAVLLNRPGRSTLSVTEALGLGYPDSGIAIGFTSTAPAGDVHTYRNVTNPNGGQLTGFFQPDGRDIDPSLSIEEIPRTARLGSFTGADPNGTWVLFINDNSAGGIGTFNNWSLTITGTIPEPTTPGLTFLAIVILFGRRRREVLRRVNDTISFGAVLNGQATSL